MTFVGFLIDSYDRSDAFRAELVSEHIPFKQGEADNVVRVPKTRVPDVLAIAKRMKIEWQWTEAT